jgi:hypothetical protein
MATEAVGDARDEGDDHDDRQQRRDGRQVEQPRAVAALEEPADRSGADRAASRTPSTIRPPSMTAARGSSAVRVEQQDAITMPNPSGSTTTAKSLAARPSAVCAKSGPSTPRTPTATP